MAPPGVGLQLPLLIRSLSHLGPNGFALSGSGRGELLALAILLVRRLLFGYLVSPAP